MSLPNIIAYLLGDLHKSIPYNKDQKPHSERIRINIDPADKHDQNAKKNGQDAASVTDFA